MSMVALKFPILIEIGNFGHDKIYWNYFYDNLVYDMGDFLEGVIGWI
jgi:hypothetical protein